LRVGLAGAGMVSGHHLAAWARVADAAVVAIADPDIGRSGSRAEAFGIGRWFERAEQMIDELRPDALDIAAPVDVHAPLCRLAAENGVAILCQKPLARTSVEAAEIIATVASRVPFMVHENWRFRPHYRQIKQWLAADLIGAVTQVQMRVHTSGLIPDVTGRLPALVRQPFLAGLPRFLVFEVLSHHLDVLGWLVGDLRLQAARLSRVSPAVMGEDAALLELQTHTGAPVVIDGSLAVPGRPVEIRDNLHITGTKGDIRLSDTALSLQADHHEQHEVDFDAMYAGSFENALRHFVETLGSAGTFETDARQNIAVLRLVDEAYQSDGGPTAGPRQSP